MSAGTDTAVAAPTRRRTDLRLFAYEAAIEGTGDVRRGTRRAFDEDEIVQHLRARGLTVTDIRPSSGLREWYDGLPFRRPKPIELIGYFRDFSLQVAAGANDYRRVFQSIARAARSAVMREAVEAVGFEATTSNSIADAMERWPFVFDEVMVALTRAGEESGTLAQTSGELREILEEERDFAADFAEATQDAKLSFATLVIAAFYIGGYALPQMIRAFGNNQTATPPILLAAGAAASWFSNPFLFVPLGVLTVVLLFPRWFEALPFMRTSQARLARAWLALHAPIFGSINRKVAMSLFGRTFGTLAQHGTDPNLALRLATPAAVNALFVRGLREIYDAFVQGIRLSTLLRQTKLFDDNFLHPLESAEEAQLDIPARLVLIGQELRKEARRELKRVSKPIGAALQLSVAAMVVMLALGIGVLAYQTYTAQAVTSP